MAQHQENMAINAQIDAGVDALFEQAEVIDNNAGEIGNEIVDQTNMAKDINNHMDQTNDNINKATDKLKDVQKISKGGLCPWIICIIFLVLTILILVLPPSILDKIRPEKRRGSW